MRLCVTVVALAVLLCVQWQVQAELSRSEIQRAVRAAKVSVDSAYEYSRRESLSRVRRNEASPADILRLMKQPMGQTREAVRRADYMNNALSYFQNPHYRHKRSTSNTTELSDQDIAALAAESGCARLTAEPSCKNVPNLYKYRTANSVCNNLEHPLWGASNTPFLRLLPAEYQDGLSLPKGWDPNVKINGNTLPLVRMVSNHILKTGNTVDEDPIFSMMVTFFGQWTDHDLTLTPHSPLIRSFNSTETCEETCERALPCFPIEVPSGDARLPQGGCMPFITSSPACTGGLVRNQINALTAFLDVGQVYWADQVKAQALRDLSSDKGLMRVNQKYNDNGREFLPFSPMTVNMCATRRRITNDSNAEEVPCFYAGDERVDENIALTSLHTLLLREHNRLARRLSQLNPHWNGEKLYHEARKILGAVSQVLTYRDYLPHIVGPDVMASHLSTYPGYNSQVDPSIANIFATAAYRFAHHMIKPSISRYNETYEEHPDYPSILLHKAFFCPWRLTHEGGIDPILRGMMGTPAKLNTPRRMMPDELREKLFKFTSALALDLGSLNMQRGRDHGLPGYNAWRGYCGLSQPKTLKELKKVLGNNDLAEKLMSLYKTPDNIDPWLGGLSEPLVPGGRVGPMFACLIAEQFERIRVGDRLWWENKNVFTMRQRKSIREASMARIICDNTGISEVPVDPFKYQPRGDGYTSCEEIPELDLLPWKEPRGHKVAFSARLGNDFPKAHRAIIFHQVLYNYPGDYNEKSGRFVCRVPGVYEFQMTLMIQKPSVGVDLMLNGEPLLHSFNTASGGNIMASGNTITPLKKGDEVYLVIIEGSNSILKDSQFNGKLLFTEDEDED
ncbi:hypothetical protein NQD34_006739 [Periophthalmus magnuspinnatus]|nr:hypothetical protein NQD34_006739 [Periophthalmus magnuspinnatus]